MSPEAAPPLWRRFRLTRVLLEWGLVGLAASLVAVLIARAPLANAFDRALYDGLIRLGGPAPSERILIVAIDDPSLTELGSWPWPRTVSARLLDHLTEAGVAAVGYDAMFLEPDPEGGDAAFAEALGRSGRTALPVLQLTPGENGKAVSTYAPIPVLAARAGSLAQVNIAPDDDGVVRRVSAKAAVEGRCWSQLSLAALALSRPPERDADCDALAAASQKTPAMLALPPQLVPFAGPPGRFRTIPAAAVVRGEVPADLLRGKLVLIGATAAGLGDRHATASSGDKGAMAGVELQANLLNAALTGAKLALVPAGLVSAAAVASIWALLLGLMLLKPRAGAWVLGGLMLSALVGCVILFRLGWWASPGPTAAGLIIAYPLWSWRRLAATSAALEQEIRRFKPDGEVVRPAFGIDPLSSQVRSLEQVSQRFRELHQMVAQTLHSLPDPTVAVDEQGVVRLANGLADAKAVGAVEGGSLETWLGQAVGQVAGGEILSAFRARASTVEVMAEGGAFIEASRAPLHGLGPAPWTIVRLADVSAIRRAVRQREEALQLLTHDIRAPFASISTLAGAEPADDRLCRIGRYAERGLSLAESYVQLSRAENAEWRPVVFDLRDAAIDAADEVWAVAQKKGVEIDVQAPEDEVLAAGDRALLTRAIVNLIENAVRYGPEGRPVEVVCRADGDAAALAVSDRGDGVDPKVVDRLFVRFARAAENTAITGAGLGLAMVALVARRMGGEARYEPRPGGGASFFIEVPLVHAPDEDA